LPDYGLYEVQEELITKRGELEEDIMTGPSAPILEHKPKGAGSAGGFGNKSSKNRPLLKTQAKEHAKVLRSQGVVRIDNVLSPAVVDKVKQFVMELRGTAQREIADQKVAVKQRFANVLLRKNRCDLTMPLTDTIYEALYESLCASSVGATIQNILGKNAVLYELSCLISDQGSDRQVVHPDTPFQDGEEPVLYTCFIALQDIDMSMGPTVWLPETHTLEIHNMFKDETAPGPNEESPKDKLLRTRPFVLGTLPKGACAIYDSRLLHCGTANRGDISRALFYFSFKNPKLGFPGNPPSIRPELQDKLTLKTLQSQLESFHKSQRQNS